MDLGCRCATLGCSCRWVSRNVSFVIAVVAGIVTNDFVTRGGLFKGGFTPLMRWLFFHVHICLAVCGLSLRAYRQMFVFSDGERFTWVHNWIVTVIIAETSFEVWWKLENRLGKLFIHLTNRDSHWTFSKNLQQQPQGIETSRVGAITPGGSTPPNRSNTVRGRGDVSAAFVKIAELVPGFGNEWTTPII